MEEYVPKRYGRRERGLCSRRFPVPLDNKTVAKIKRKQRLWCRYLKTRDHEIYLEYCKIRNQVKSLTRKITRQYEKNIATQAKTNPKKFWKYAQSKTKTHVNVSELYINEEKRLTSSDKEKAEVLASYFASVFTVENKQNISDVQVEEPDIDKLVKINITTDLVKKKLTELKVSKSPGPEKIHPRILYELSHCLSEPVTKIFQNTVEKGELPRQWKQSNITAVFDMYSMQSFGINNTRPNYQTYEGE